MPFVTEAIDANYNIKNHSSFKTAIDQIKRRTFPEVKNCRNHNSTESQVALNTSQETLIKISTYFHWKWVPLESQ